MDMRRDAKYVIRLGEQREMKQIDKLLKNIINLDPVDFMGLAHVLRVPLTTMTTDEEGGHSMARPFVDVLQDVLEAFEHSNRQRRREILQIVEAAAKNNKEDTADASNS